MKFYLLLLAAAALALSANGLPLPAGDIVKYRVPNKFFNQPNMSPEASLYNLLAQIHYGGATQTVTVHSTDVESEDVSSKIVSVSTESSTNEAPEVISVNSTVRCVSNY